MTLKFTKKTFEYFEDAKDNAFDSEWFKSNRGRYEDFVKEPFEFLVNRIDLELEELLTGVPIGGKSICRPKRPSNRAIDKGFNKNFSSIDIGEKKTSLFEWNPGFHLQFGSDEDDNRIAGGLYLVSGRQIKELRKAFDKDYKYISKLLSEKDFVESWGGIQGDQYKRFPKIYSEQSPAAKFLWFKQFYFSKNCSRSQVIRKDFFDQVVNDLKASAPVLNWIRSAVGTYKK